MRNTRVELALTKNTALAMIHSESPHGRHAQTNGNRCLLVARNQGSPLRS
ncbi:Uncharacterised protein [Vibrio cholerae]|nr:Uncharacterised protein [Vibrio cholerae]CSI66511.1 Uncharacterised protein [Vibrio cholerae]